jgi:hypothetical protein
MKLHLNLQTTALILNSQIRIYFNSHQKFFLTLFYQISLLERLKKPLYFLHSQHKGEFCINIYYSPCFAVEVYFRASCTLLITALLVERYVLVRGTDTVSVVVKYTHVTANLIL